MTSGTNRSWATEPTKIFNQRNERLPFGQVRRIDSIPFGPNQAIVVIKTFNSWHSIRPMRASAPGVMRKTVNVNILYD